MFARLKRRTTASQTSRFPHQWWLVTSAGRIDRDVSRYTPGAGSIAPEPAQTPWHLATRITFRFCFVYLGLYVLFTQMLRSLIPFPIPFPQFGVTAPMKNMVGWVGAHVLHVAKGVAPHPTGSGDTIYDWSQVVTLLLIAAIASAIWSFVARDRREHARLNKWFRVFIRFALATTFVSYGFSKVPPLQMPTTFLARLVEPYGNFSPMGVLWYSIGASPAYEMFAGAAEVFAASLLFIPRTAGLGSMVALMDSIAIFTLNMTYDVPVKLFSFHLVLMSLFLLAPNLVRLRDFFVLQRATAVRREEALGSTDRARRNSVIAQIVYGGLVLVLGAYGGYQGWTRFGGGAPKSPLYGIWEIQRLTVDGRDSPALVSDSARWRRVVFQGPSTVTFQRMNDSLVMFGTKIHASANSIEVTQFDSARTKSTLTFERPAKDRLLLDGTLDKHAVHMELSYRDPDSFLIRSRGFNWVQEYPYNK